MGDYFYKRNAERALGGMMGLTLEERGAYNTVLDLIYLKKNKLENDDEFMCRWLGVDIRVWRRLRARLVELEKLYITEDGFIRNKAADEEIKSRHYKIPPQDYPQNNPQGDIFDPKNPAAAQHPPNLSRTSAELPPNLSPKFTPKSEAQLNNNNNLTTPLVRARELARIQNPDNNKTPYPEDAPRNGVLKNGKAEGKSFDIIAKLSDADLADAKNAAPGWDIYQLASTYNAGIHDGKREPPTYPGKAFAAWCARYTKGKSP